MNIKHIKNILPPQDGAAKITAMAWSPNNIKLAVATAERVVLLFDEQGERRDKFSTKPADAKYGKKSYLVKAIAFSPDSTKLAIGQTDNIIYVYKIGEDWGEKKVICNKFVQSSQVTCLAWPVEGPIVFGLLEGKVRAANIKSNKSQTLYQTDSYVVSIASNLRGTAFLSGHADGSVVRFYVADDPYQEPQGKIISHSCPPYALAWTSSSVVVAGCDKRVVVYSKMGKITQQFDYSRDATEREFSAVVTSPSGQALVIGSYNRLRIFDYNTTRGMWDEKGTREFDGFYTITALAWKRDGSRLVCGTLCGAVELFDSVLRRSVWKNKWEMTYVGPSQVLVKPLAGSGPFGSRGVILRSQYGFEIHDVRIMGKDRYLVARTNETLLLGDLHRNLLSEVHWGVEPGSEKFYFDNENVCLIFNAGELSLVEYGNNDILGSVRTEFMNPHLISVRLNERRQRGIEDNKKMAYLLDLKTICLVDLTYGLTLGQVTHDSRIDWVELNETGTQLLFRDKRLRLMLVNVSTLNKSTILNYSTFVQWVPGSDVVVAQSREQLCVWYNIDTPERVTTFHVKGEVTDVERADGRTEVIVQDGVQELSYALDEGLIEFGTAIDDGDYLRAMNYLETLPMTAEAETMWHTLARLTLEGRHLYIAERCFAALGEVSKVRYLQGINHIRQMVQDSTGEEGMDHYEVLARLAILDKQFKTAESIYLDNNQLDEAMEMYQELHKWDEAVQLAEIKGHPDVESLRRAHTQWLLDTHQEERAGQLKEAEGDHLTAINMYLKAGMPAKASRLATSVTELREDPELIARIASALLRADLFEQAGDLYEKVGQPQKALESYRKGQAYPRAVELARHIFPAEVVQLEEEWGNQLMSNKQADAAISHFIEAGRTIKALEAAITARQWKKAMHIIEVIDDKDALQPHLLKLGQHFASHNELQKAEYFYLKGGMHNEAINMYNQAGEWERAHQLASKYMGADKVAVMYVNQAQVLEEQGKFREAEKLYISVHEPDLAITMYKKQRQFDQMMRLVKEYHSDLVQSTHLHLASQLEQEGNYHDAEKHYIAADDWKAAVNMYRGVDMWEEAYRVAKQRGGANAGKQVAFLWARTLRGDAAVKLLKKFGLLEQCIDYACESMQFEFAFELARTANKQKLPEIHYKYAMALEDDGKYQEAESAFIQADKPKEAVLMYVHAQDWESAQRVAEAHDPDSVGDVLVGQAKVAFTDRDYPRAEALLLRAQRPELAVKFYRDSDQWMEALRVCKEYLPHKLKALQDEYDRTVLSKGSQDAQGLLQQAKQWEESGEYSRAVDCYMKVTPAMSSDASLLEKAWTKAGELALKFLPEDRSDYVARTLGPQLLDIKRYTAAAQMFLAGDMVKEAVDAFIAGREWSKAKKVASEFDPRYESYVDSAYKDFLKNEGKAEALVDVDLTGALDMYVESGQWSRALDTAAQHGPQLLHKYLARYASSLIKDNQAVEALGLYKQYGAPPFAQNYNIYRRLALDLMSLHSLCAPQAYRTWADLRDILLSLVDNLRQHEDTDGVMDEFELLLQLAHYLAARSAYMATPQLENLVAKVSVSVLRYTHILPADKAFYEAGMACKEVGWKNMAFVFLNRFLDLCEAIEEGSLDSLDHTDFLDTDIPYEIPLPDALSIPESLREEAKEWVLAVSMDQQVEQILPQDERMVYEASLVDNEGSTYPPCVISGYPVIRSRLDLKRGQAASKEDWNKLVMATKMATTPECQDVLKFITAWCGGLPTMGYNFQ
ncbi:intraflagellar transport protein 172 homolog [Eriocheir sinensis]|uniref:intraflagellar transport protein 172 homolog n=1 Tax=Eriocheir sinensis TaxID=95602 RepID=UPI0021CA2FAC|nr:intraflagellar transport protein 172 homolog [Eriocheir sinensis]